MKTIIVITYHGQPYFSASSTRRLSEEEVNELVQEGLIGIVDPQFAEINIYHNF